MKRTFIIILVTLVALGLFIACDNNVQTDYNYLTEDQKVQYGLLSIDMAKAVSLVIPNDFGTVTSSSKGVSVLKVIARNNDKAVVSVRYTFNNYEGNSGTINGSVISNYLYDSLNDSYYSSYTGTFMLTSEKDGVTHTLIATSEGEADKNTGKVKSVVETGTFDGAKYRETKTY